MISLILTSEKVFPFIRRLIFPIKIRATLGGESTGKKYILFL
jgi:hypothetical protein